MLTTARNLAGSVAARNLAGSVAVSNLAGSVAVSNLAGSVAFDMSTALTVVWVVSSDTIAVGDYTRSWKLVLLCGLVPLLLLGLIPKDKEDQRKLQQETKQ